MAISTNSIIHYTKTLDNLLQILETGFSLKYCKEEFKSKDLNLKYAYPMICFCDIPLSEVKQHLDSYGHFGIGLKKNWAINKGLNPVLYLEKQSSLSETIMQQISRIDSNRKEVKANPAVEKIDGVWVQELLTLCSYVKNYEGDLIIDGKLIKDYRFYNEREWRYVPTISELKGNSRAIALAKYIADKDKYNTEIAKIKLDFDLAKDISYIIVKEDQDIHKAVEFITIKFKKRLLAADLEILLTKLISTKQIINDF